MRRFLFTAPLLMVGLCHSCDAGKEGSVFYPPSLLDRANTNIRKHAWAKQAKERIVKAAQPWVKMSDDQLWDLMFGATITRSWMVWSDGYCPSCNKGVPMYNWEMDGLGRPWKVRCPHCQELFPKNDFLRFYRSGLDERGVFDPKLADRSLLFNAEHPNLADPLRSFGVDDGEGYADGDKRWRFIGTYLVYGQWKQVVWTGIRNLAAAYLLTGDRQYAHKAGVLLDRVADLYPTFDFGKQGVVYEQAGAAGYVSTWHDACEETRELALAYDQVFDGLRCDEELVAFLSDKAKHHRLDNPKSSWEDVRRNIEDRILGDALRNQGKIHSNYPRKEITVVTIKAVLGWPENRDDVFADLDALLEKATAVDGVTGEKGLAAYSSYTIQGVAILLAQFARIDSSFLEEMLRRHPRIHDMYRFHIDTHCLGRYYPLIGDTGSFAAEVPRYVAVELSNNPGLQPSMYTFLWELYRLTGDAAFVQVLYRVNGDSVAGLPYDLFAEDQRAFQSAVRSIIRKEGKTPTLGSVNKQEWHLAILRSGRGADARALWLDYDSGGGHGHMDGMNLGLFAKGLDLMPDFGYPPVQFGGWGSPRARWYTRSAAHNTVVVDGKDSISAAGRTTLWADGKRFRAVRASGPNLIGGKQFERTACLVDISERDSYILDIFRVVGGADHAKFTHSHFGQITTRGLSLEPCEDYGYDTIMRNFRCDPSAQPGWSVDWKIEDRYRLLPPGSDVHLRCTDLTTGAQAMTAEGWVVAGMWDAGTEVWIPRVVVRRQAKDPGLASTFVSVIEPYEKESNITQIRRLPLQLPDGAKCPDSNVAVEVRLADGRRDLIVAADAENPLGLKPMPIVFLQPDWDVRLDGEMCAIRVDAAGGVRWIALCRGRSLTVDKLSLKLTKQADVLEVSFKDGRATIESGSLDDIESLLVNGRNALRR